MSTLNQGARLCAAEISRQEIDYKRILPETLVIIKNPRIDNYLKPGRDGQISLAGKDLAELIFSLPDAVLPDEYLLGFDKIRLDTNKRTVEGDIHSTRAEYMDPENGEVRSLDRKVGFYHFSWGEEQSQLSVYVQADFPHKPIHGIFGFASWLLSGREPFVRDLIGLYSTDSKL
ncbi:TPA: hypothetical protein HA239_04970 [Candidatus Woesearchaeota archaeon]|nr:hypothetical protein QT06_C0001G0345 [archaeon GW2011_AR15]MBS3103662.1 hypothetical protein [Candidatus Woesearchaeota archaeon]HIH41736.1 hypothetical protein [Candidatus Woesearchaeota archaeon]